MLYVEDDQLNRELLENILELKPNIGLLAAEDAQNGIKMAIDHKPDLILMDLNLPDMDGFEAFQRLKGFQETKNIPVVALSGNALPSDIKKALDLGFAEYLTKPFNISKLYQVIGEVLKRTA